MQAPAFVKRALDAVPKPPALDLLLAEAGAGWEHARYLLPSRWRGALPRGDDHPVMVLPGFLTSSNTTVLLRRGLRRLGYRVHPWGLGRNTGYRDDLAARLSERLDELYRRYQQPISLVGWSLGGVFARELARTDPDRVRLVISMGSPIRNPSNSTNVRALYEAVSGHSFDDIPLRLIAEMDLAPPVPTTAIYTVHDGVVDWRSTIDCTLRADVENVEVGGAHCGLGVNPYAVTVVADRLAQPNDQWRPFDYDAYPLFIDRRRKHWHSVENRLLNTLDSIEDHLHRQRDD